MKTFLLIFLISLRDGQSPVVEKIEQPNMQTCQQQEAAVAAQLTVKPNCPKEALSCTPPYIVHTACVTGSGS
jgi:hypothetical protein